MHLQYQDMGGFEMVSTTTKALVPPINAPFMLWLKTQIMKVWIDPECGDGICDSPYEFPSFGRTTGKHANTSKQGEPVDQEAGYVQVMQIKLFKLLERMGRSRPGARQGYCENDIEGELQ
ncbi:hypothetical protein CYMTET_43430 [Cymbomonas tetramitiformis]|uniref:Uncharacterized protein n=1 Tax=Cymbomonas tetramitiformis TaxID=36881 RepID=A0AAE0C287_9CHLO|nr:hypothetical protein CYMTET_43430 [Cymbomonas tetramitiformis]